MDREHVSDPLERSQPTQASAFGVLLRKYRLAAGFSQGVLAELARMSVNGISALERGDRRTPQRETLTLLSDALNLDHEQRAAFVAAARQKLPRQRDGGATVAAGPWPASPSQKVSLPLSSFVGRADELRDIAQLLREHRLVTLTGAGGIGKTRAALQVALQWGGHSKPDIRVVELAPLSDASQVVTAVAAALGAQEAPDRPMMETLVAYLSHKTATIVLDNCEHLIDEAARLTAILLQRCPNVRILATSRERLRIAGEHAYRLPSLETPSREASSNLPAIEAGKVAAIALFVDRARAADHRFALRDEDVFAVCEICRRVDGIPLAIELAAARVTVLSPAALAEKLDRRFALLSAGGRNVLPRQQTMRATIDWSIALLNEAERKLLRRLGIFTGGWALEAAEAVCCDEDTEPIEVTANLMSLAEKSLVTVRFSSEFPVVDRFGTARSGRQARYALLESIRDYAMEELVAHGEDESFARRHADWAADYGEWLQEWRFYDSEGFYRVASLPDAFEMPNRQGALRWALKGEDSLLAGRIAGTFPWFDVSSDILTLIAEALARIEGTPHRLVEARLWLALADGAFVGRRVLGERSYEAVRKATSILERCGERSYWLAEAYELTSDMCWRTGRYAEAFRASDLQMEITQELGATNNANRASWLSDRGLLLKTVHRYEEARECLTEAIALSELRSHLLPWTSALADVEAESGNIRRAVALSDQAAAAITRDEWPHLEGTERGALVANRTKAVAYYLMLGELDAARRAVVDAFDLASTRWAGISIVTHLCLAATIAMSGDVTRGARMKAYVDAYYASNGIVRLATDERTYQFLADALAESSTDPEVQRAAAEGAALNWEQAADLGAAMAKTLRALA